MAFKTTYRRLTEVRFLHSFYLENDVNQPFYTLSEEDKSLRLIRNSYDIRNDVDIVPTEGTTQFLSEHKLIFLPTFMGFVIALQVEMSNGIARPQAELPSDWRITFKIIGKNADWLTFTNAKFKTAQSPLRLFWTNNNDISNKVMPSLSAPLSAFDAAKQYEMGEWTLQSNAPNRAQENNGQWQTGEPFHQYTTEADRRALPRQSRFSLPMPLATQADIVLTKINDTAVPPFEAKWVFDSGSDTPLSKITVDFTFNPSDKMLISSGLYNLDIVCRDKNGVSSTTTYPNIVLLDGIKTTDFGVVELVQKQGLPNGQNLLNADGSVIDGGRTFEVRLQNRITYWQYKENRGATLNGIDNANHDVLDDALMTKQARALTRSQMPIDFAENIKLPSPSKLTIKEKDNRYVTEVIY